MKYRKKPVIIEAVQWTGNNDLEIIQFINGDKSVHFEFIDTAWEAGKGAPHIMGINIETLEGIMKVSKNDYIIKGVQGEFYPCKPDIFIKTYEEVENE